MAETFVASLEPREVFGHFDRLLAIPRPSKQEQAAVDYVVAVARSRGLEPRFDARGNFCVDVPASPGREDAPAVVLQGHLDMVTVKEPEVEHDFDRDPIRPRLEGDWLMASGTTLGADNGIGVAEMLAWIDAPAGPHGPLELLFTLDEETGLQGVMDLDGSIVRGRRLINLDSEEEGVITIGCAGARGSRILLPIDRAPLEAGEELIDLRVSGLVGGHSGMDVHKGRGNAIGLLARALGAIDQAVGGRLRLVRFSGGQSHNAIPREAFATVAVREGDRELVEQTFAAEAAAITHELAPTDPEVAFVTAAADASAQTAPLTPASSTDVLRLVLAVPYGVLAMSRTLPGLVETSTNLARVATEAGSAEVFLASRSSVGSALDAFCRRVRAIAALAGGQVEETRGYPGWAPDPSSALLAETRAVLTEALGHEPEVGACHAGLECGVIGAKCPGMDMVSIGPIIENPHSPHERVHIASVGRFHSALAMLLDRLSAPG